MNGVSGVFEMSRRTGRFAGNRSPRRRRSAGARRGTVLLIVMVALLLIVAIGVSLSRLAVSQHRQSARSERQVQADWLARAAVDRGAARIRRDRLYKGETWQLQVDGGGAEVSIRADEGVVSAAVTLESGDARPPLRAFSSANVAAAPDPDPDPAREPSP